MPTRVPHSVRALIVAILVFILLAVAVGGSPGAIEFLVIIGSSTTAFVAMAGASGSNGSSLAMARIVLLGSCGVASVVLLLVPEPTFRFPDNVKPLTCGVPLVHTLGGPDSYFSDEPDPIRVIVNSMPLEQYRSECFAKSRGRTIAGGAVGGIAVIGGLVLISKSRRRGTDRRGGMGNPAPEPDRAGV